MKYFISTMTDLVKATVASLFKEPNSLSTEEISAITSSLRLHLDIFEHGLNTSNHPLSATDSSRLAEILVGRIYWGILLTADFLQLLHLHIPIRGLTRPSATTATPLPLPISDLFKGMKRDVITILTQLLHQDDQLQNTIREKGGVTLVLAQCNIDDDNPCTSVSYEN